MLQIRLKGPSSEGGGSAKLLTVDTVTVACPDHLVLADLPVAKRLGTVNAASLVKTVGRRSRRQLGERVHFCVRCDFPIAIYGRLSPCEHAFCLDCARSDSICYLCDECIQKIQTIKMMEGIFICAAPHCLKSFLKKTEFESHIHEMHIDLLLPKAEKEDGNESEAVSTKQSTASESTARAPPRPIFSSNSNSQVHDREDKGGHRPQLRDQPPARPIIQPMPPPQHFGQMQTHTSELQQDNNHPQGFDRPGPHNSFHPQSFASQGGVPPQESSQSADKQQGASETPFPEYPTMHAYPMPNFAMPFNSNQALAPPFFPPFTPEGAQQFYGAPYEMARPDSATDVGCKQGSLLGFPPGPGGLNFPENYPRPWNMGPAAGGMPFEQLPAGQGVSDGFTNMVDSQGRVAFFHGDFGRNMGVMPSNMPPSSTDKGMELMQGGGGGNALDPRDGKGILAAQPLSLPPPPPPGPHISQPKRGNFYSGEMGRDGQGFGWQQQQHEKHDSGFGSSQDQ